MNLNQLMQDYLSEEGYRPQVAPFGLSFKSEGLNYLYFKDERDDQYFRLMMPAIFDVTAENEDAVYRAMDDVNSNLKVVKLYLMGDGDSNSNERSVWVAFEILADTTPELKDIVPRALELLRTARVEFYRVLETLS